MPTERPACSEMDSAVSNRRDEAPWNEPVSRSGSEPESASLNQSRVARLPEGLKPAIQCEETFASNAGALRGERGQRAGKVELGRLGDPCRQLREERSEMHSESISCALTVWESERPVVAKRRGNARGAKGPWLGRADSEGESAARRNPTTGQTLSLKSEAAVGNQIRPSADESPDLSVMRKRMREICMSGLRRGGHAAVIGFAPHSLRPSPLYCDSFEHSVTA